jgi:hypothetical protein
VTVGPHRGHIPPEDHGQQRTLPVDRPRSSAGSFSHHRRSSDHPGSLSHGGSRLSLDPRWVCAATGTRGHRRSPTSHGLKQQVARLPAQAIGMLQAANQHAVPEVVDREVPGSAAENRWEKRTYLLLRKLRSRLDRATAPNTPTRLHIAPQPDQETAQPSQFARRSRFVETPAFLTGPQSTGGEAS